MLQKRKNRKNRKYFRYLGIILVILGALLISYTAFVLASTYIFAKPIVSPLPKNFKSQNINLEELLKKERIKFLQISTATDSSYLIHLEDGATAILSPRKNLLEQVRSLQIVLSRLTIEGKRFKSLDFRFDKLVISF